MKHLQIDCIRHKDFNKFSGVEFLCSYSQPTMKYNDNSIKKYKQQHNPNKLAINFE